MKPTAKEYSAAILAGAQSRRCYGRLTDNPYSHGTTERDRILSECWESGWNQVDKSPRRKR